MDLNLARVLDAVLVTGSVTTAARKLGLSQPATSHALARLQRTLERPLFRRQGRTLVPTPETLALAPLLRSAVASVEAALRQPSRFEPAAARGVIRIAMSDFWQANLLPPLVVELERLAPDVSLDVCAASFEMVSEGLRLGRLDAAIYLESLVSPGVRSEALIEDRYVCVVRRGSPVDPGNFKLAEYARHRMVLLLPRGAWEDRAQAAMRSAGLSQKLVLAVSNLTTVLEIVSTTDYLTVLPRQVALAARKRHALKVLALPVDFGRLSLALYWPIASESDPLHAWFRTLLIRVARRVWYGARRPVTR